MSHGNVACVFFFARKEVISLNKICNLLITQPKVREGTTKRSGCLCQSDSGIYAVTIQNGKTDFK